MDEAVLVVGAGIAGMKASLMLAEAGRQVYLVEKSSVIGGRLIGYEDVFPAMECATCMVSPMQQEILRTDEISTFTLSEVVSIDVSRGSFDVLIRQRASSVDPVACIGCGECWNACPVDTDNAFEHNLSKRKAISVPCAGALPNVPWIDRDICLRWKGEDCSVCSEACVFGAVDYTSEDRDVKLKVSSIVLATGFSTSTEGYGEHYRLGSCSSVFTAGEFERYYASNGPTSGSLVNKDGKAPESAAILVHAGGTGMFSSINTMYCLKYLHYLKEKLPAIEPVVLLDSEYSPSRLEDPYHGRWSEADASVIAYDGIPEVECAGDDAGVKISCVRGSEKFETRVDMLVLGTPMVPSEDTAELCGILGIGKDPSGFVSLRDPGESSVETSVDGIYVAGCAGGPLNIADAVITASAAVGRILSQNGRAD